MCPWHAEGMSYVWSSFEDKDLDQSYEDYYTGAPWDLNVTKWLSSYPSKQAEDVIFFAYMPGVPNTNTTDTIEMGEAQRGRICCLNHIYCVGNSPLKKILWIQIRGLCEQTKYDKSYYWAPHGSGGAREQKYFVGQGKLGPKHGEASV